MAVLFPDAARRTEMQGALAGEVELVVLDTHEAALDALGRLQADAVIVDAGVVEALLDAAEALARRAGATRDRDRGAEQLARKLRDRHALLTVAPGETGAEVCARLRALLRRRRGRRTTPVRTLRADLETTESTAPTAHTVLDVSNRGLAVLVEPGHDLAGYLPGTRGQVLRLACGGREVLAGVAVAIRHLGLLPGANPGSYRVGMAFLPSRGAAGAEEEPIADLARKVALLRDALAGAGLSLQLADDPSRTAFFGRGLVAPAEGFVLLEGDVPPFLRPGEVVRGTFDLAGASYSFLAAVAAPSDLAPATSRARHEGPFVGFHLPRLLRSSSRRALHRHHPRPDRPVEAEIASPFGGALLRRPVLDINTSGLALAIDSDREVLPVGTILESVALHLPDGVAVHARGRVRSLTALEGDPRRLKCGVELEGVGTQERAQIADGIVRGGVRGLHNGEALGADALWDFLKETGFMYPAKEEHLRPILPAISRTLSALLAQRGGIGKTLLFRDGGRLLGHLSIVQLYSRTWLVQHLAARGGDRGSAAARFLNLGMTEFLDQDPGIEWLKIYFRPDNAWPARMFGGFARRVADPMLSELRTLRYLVAPSVSGSPLPDDPAGRNIEIRDADASARALIEKHTVASGRILAMRAEDLCASLLGLEGLSAAYGARGLERRREILVASRSGRPLAFALLERSSPGLNLSGLASASTIQALEEDPAAERALALAVRRRSAELGDPWCVLLDGRPAVPGLEAAGFTARREYCCWTWHRSLYRAYYEHAQRLHARSGPPRARAEAEAG